MDAKKRLAAALEAIKGRNSLMQPRRLLLHPVHVATLTKQGVPILSMPWLDSNFGMVEYPDGTYVVLDLSVGGKLNGFVVPPDGSSPYMPNQKGGES